LRAHRRRLIVEDQSRNTPTRERLMGSSET